jgi:predicted dehydrogenase
MSQLRIGIVGTGMIANVIARAVSQAPSVKLVAVSSRNQEKARAFADQYGAAKAFSDWRELASCRDVDAVYTAVPTSAREEVCLFAAAERKHVLAEKPFAGVESVERIQQACRAYGVACMDATHFSHHPRTVELKARSKELLGNPLCIRSSFFFPVQDRENIRYNPAQEPTGAVGDMAWYNLRAAVEYLPDRGELKEMHCRARRDSVTGAVVGGGGFAVFEQGHTTFDFGYDAGTVLMDLELLGGQGVVQMSDFVQDWTHGIGFPNPGHVVGFTHRVGVVGPGDFERRDTPSDCPQSAIMLEDFARMAREPDGKASREAARLTRETQYLVDRLWASLSLC